MAEPTEEPRLLSPSAFEDFLNEAEKTAVAAAKTAQELTKKSLNTIDEQSAKTATQTVLRETADTTSPTEETNSAAVAAMTSDVLTKRLYDEMTSDETLRQINKYGGALKMLLEIARDNKGFSYQVFKQQLEIIRQSNDHPLWKALLFLVGALEGLGNIAVVGRVLRWFLVSVGTIDEMEKRLKVINKAIILSTTDLFRLEEHPDFEKLGFKKPNVRVMRTTIEINGQNVPLSALDSGFASEATLGQRMRAIETLARGIEYQGQKITLANLPQDTWAKDMQDIASLSHEFFGVPAVFPDGANGLTSIVLGAVQDGKGTLTAASNDAVMAQIFQHVTDSGLTPAELVEKARFFDNEVGKQFADDGSEILTFSKDNYLAALRVAIRATRSSFRARVEMTFQARIGYLVRIYRFISPYVIAPDAQLLKELDKIEDQYGTTIDANGNRITTALSGVVITDLAAALTDQVRSEIVEVNEVVDSLRNYINRYKAVDWSSMSREQVNAFVGQVEGQLAELGFSKTGKITEKAQRLQQLSGLQSAAYVNRISGIIEMIEKVKGSDQTPAQMRSTLNAIVDNMLSTTDPYDLGRASGRAVRTLIDNPGQNVIRKWLFYTFDAIRLVAKTAAGVYLYLRGTFDQLKHLLGKHKKKKRQWTLPARGGGTAIISLPGLDDGDDDGTTDGTTDIPADQPDPSTAQPDPSTTQPDPPDQPTQPDPSTSQPDQTPTPPPTPPPVQSTPDRTPAPPKITPTPSGITQDGVLVLHIGDMLTIYEDAISTNNPFSMRTTSPKKNTPPGLLDWIGVMTNRGATPIQPIYDSIPNLLGYLQAIIINGDYVRVSASLADLLPPVDGVEYTDDDPDLVWVKNTQIAYDRRTNLLLSHKLNCEWIQDPYFDKGKLRGAWRGPIFDSDHVFPASPDTPEPATMLNVTVREVGTEPSASQPSVKALHTTQTDDNGNNYTIYHFNQPLDATKEWVVDCLGMAVIKPPPTCPDVHYLAVTVGDGEVRFVLPSMTTIPS